VQQPRVAIVVHVAGGFAGAHRQTAGHPRGGADLKTSFSGQYRGRAGRVQVGPDDQRAGPRRADGVDRGGGAAEPLVDLELGIQSETGEQNRCVAALQQR
jgi:hypothetical protein